MKKAGRFFEIAYLVVAVVFGYEAINIWGEDKSYVYLALMALAIFMSFFKKRFREKREERFNQNK